MYIIFKRLIDLISALVILIIIFPFLLPIAIILKLSAEGEVFYLQSRLGYRNKEFKIWKFATMLKDSPILGTKSITLVNDYRVTKPGKFLRKTKINELPQIINIILGDISLVGPRPLVLQDFQAYPESIQKSIYNIKPGITGLGSIVFRDEEKIISENYDQKDPHKYYKETIAPYKGALELWYQHNRSIVLDFKIIFLTAWVILFPDSRLYEKWFKDLPARGF